MGLAPDYVLAMNVSRFFAMNRALIDIENDERTSLLLDLTDIVAQSFSGLEYHKELRNYFKERALPEAKRARDPRVFDSDDKNQSAMAANILLSAFKQKAKIEGLDG
jgi:hypothetical protein